MPTFGELLKSFRARRSLTQQQLANDVPVIRQSVSNWERGQYLPDRDTIVRRLKPILGLSLDEVNQLLHTADYALLIDSSDVKTNITVEKSRDTTITDQHQNQEI